MRKRPRVALNFLTAYVWAFLTLLVVMGALYYFGVSDFSKFLPQKCIFPSQFECLEFSFSGKEPYGDADDVIKFKLVNNLGEKIEIDSIAITNDAMSPLSCDLSEPFESSWEAGEYKEITFTGCTGGVFIAKKRTEAKVTLNYCAPLTPGCTEDSCAGAGCPVHKVNGKITAVVVSS